MPSPVERRKVEARLHEIGRFLQRAGELILMGGGETSRVEDTVQRMGLAVGLDDVQAFCTLTGIMLGLELGGVSLTRIVAVDKRTTNLAWVAGVNSISHKLEVGKLSFAEAVAELEAVPLLEPPLSPAWQVAAMALCAAAWGGFLGASRFDFVPTLIAGAVARITLGWAARRELASFLALYLATLAGASCCEGAAQLVPGCNLRAMLVGLILPLLPGLALTSAVRDLVKGDLLSGLARGVEAFLVAAALVAGMQTASVFLPMVARP